MQAIYGSTISPEHKSTSGYHVCSENHFVVLPDEKTLIGFHFNSSLLQIEDITQNKFAVKIDSCRSELHTIIFNQELEVLLTGYYNGEAIQYHKNPNWKQQKNYGDLQIGNIFSSDQMGCIAVMGGFKRNWKNLRMIDLKEQKIIGSPAETAFKSVYSLCFGITSGSKVFLSMGGLTPDYSNGKTDIFDVTNLFETQNVQKISPPSKVPYLL